MWVEQLNSEEIISANPELAELTNKEAESINFNETKESLNMWNNGIIQNKTLAKSLITNKFPNLTGDKKNTYEMQNKISYNPYNSPPIINCTFTHYGDKNMTDYKWSIYMKIPVNWGTLTAISSKNWKKAKWFESTKVDTNRVKNFLNNTTLKNKVIIDNSKWKEIKKQ